MSYRDDAAQLARGLADLLSARPAVAEPPAAAALPAEQAHAALVCRDTVVGELRDLTGALLHASPQHTPAATDLLARSPAHALHAALRAVPRSGGRNLTLTAALTLPADPPVAAWQRAASTAVALQRYHGDAGELPGPAAWSMARDLAALSSTLTILDTDLAAAIPTAAGAAGPDGDPIGFGEAAGALLDEPTHALLQLAAAEVTAHTADLPYAAAALPGTLPRVLPVPGLADLPAAGRQLADLLSPDPPSHLECGVGRNSGMPFCCGRIDLV